MFSPFNYKEIELLAAQITPKVQGLYVERVYIPARPKFAKGFIKSEWALKLSSRTAECQFVLSARARRPYFAIYPKLAAAKEGSRSGFDLSLNKILKGLRVEDFKALPKERAVYLKFKDGENEIWLLLMMIPAAPEALVLQIVPGGDCVVLASTRLGQTSFKLPDGSKAPDTLQVRDEFRNSDFQLTEWLNQSLDEEAFLERKLVLEKEIRAKKKHFQDFIRKNQASLDEAQKEPNWRHFGDLLKGTLSQNAPFASPGIREAVDYETGEIVRIKCDPALDLKTQIEKFYHQSKRALRRTEESKNRLSHTQDSLNQLISIENEVSQLSSQNFEKLSACESKLGITGDSAPSTTQAKATTGKCYTSKEGLLIWAGRDRTENLEITFKKARGNDLWMHVRGRPSAHVIIQIPAGKSASLDSLLDAAHILLHHSGGKEWGKTDIDYTFRKHVKKIKDSTEVSYTQNKTLSVTFDKKRFERVFATAAV